MVSTKEIMAWIDANGAITARNLRDQFDLEPAEARRVLIKLLEKDLIMWCPGLPKQGVFFTAMREDVRPFGLMLKKQAQSGVEIISSAETRERIKDIFDDRPAMGYLIKEIMELTDLSRPRVVKALEFLVKHGELHKQVAARPASFGRPPYIYALNKRAADVREIRYQRDRSGKTETAPESVVEKTVWSYDIDPDVEDLI